MDTIFIYEKTDVQVIVVTAPMSDIVADNVKKLKKTGIDNGFKEQLILQTVQ